MIEISNVSFGYGRDRVLEDVSCRFENGQVTALIGPNGAGKSTLMRLCAGILKPSSGSVQVDGSIRRDAKAFARQLAFLPQHMPIPALTVRSLVRLGRFAHSSGNEEAVERAIREAGVEHLAGRDARSLSGGQRQMACLAMLLAQESPNVLLDEPFTHLDIGSQLEVTRLIRRMRDQGRCVVVVVHDLNLLSAVCDRALLMRRGRLVFDGPPGECLYSQAFENAFGVRAVPGGGVSFEKG